MRAIHFASVIAVLAALCLVLSTVAAGPQGDPFLGVNPENRLIIDQDGRVRIFHGVNVVYKVPPFHPDIDGPFDPSISLNEQDMDQMKEWGFNFVRLYVAWPAVEPVRGQFNYTYLDVLRTIVRRLEARGIYTLLDCHQDVFARKTCGEGAPAWAVESDQNSTLPFPDPVFPNMNMTFDADGNPNLADCLQHLFASYYMTDQVSQAFQALYENVDGLRDEFTKFWTVVASHFANETGVIGYELINEPWVGDIYRDPELAKPGEADRKNLAPLYETLTKSIRNVDADHMIFFEPSVLMSQFFDAGFKENPAGGSAALDKTIFSWHMYCADMNGTSYPRSRAVCDALDSETMIVRTRDSDRMGTAAFLTEFGALYNDSISAAELSYVTTLADENILSWSYWQFKYFLDYTTQTHAIHGEAFSEEGFWDKEGNVQTLKLRTLSRTYAYAIQGVPTRTFFNDGDSIYDLSYNVDLSIPSPTEIYFNRAIRYEHGYEVSMHPSDAVTVKEIDDYHVALVPNTSVVKDGDLISIKFAPKRANMLHSNSAA